MPYRYLEDIATADAAFEAWGNSVEEMFIAAADATMNVMVGELSTIHKIQEIRLEAEHEELDLLLFKFLNELVFYKDAERLLLRVVSVSISRSPSLFILHAVACGEELNPEKHALSADVKAVTLHRFRVEETTDGWKATVILDI